MRCGAEKPRDPGQPSEKNTFTCPFETVGVILKITAHGSRRVLALCDVNAYGAGTSYVTAKVRLTLRRRYVISYGEGTSYVTAKVRLKLRRRYVLNGMFQLI